MDDRRPCAACGHVEPHAPHGCVHWDRRGWWLCGCDRYIAPPKERPPCAG